MASDVTTGFLRQLRKEGAKISEPRWWPINAINFRMHPCPRWEEMQEGANRAPIILCRQCYVVLDGWHRLARAWRAGREEVQVRFVDGQHWMLGEGVCRVDRTNFITDLTPMRDMDVISGCYHAKDWDNPIFRAKADELVAYGDHVPLTRLWEHTRAVLFLGNVARKLILDVGTRESLVPQFLADHGAEVTAVDLHPDEIVHRHGVQVQYADVSDHLPFADRSFDFVLCTAVVKQIADAGVPIAMRELARVARQYVAVSTDFSQRHMGAMSSPTTRTLYDAESFLQKIIRPSRLNIITPADFKRADWEDWPIQAQAPSVYDMAYPLGINVQVAFALLSAKRRKAK